MKRKITLILSFLIILSITACSSIPGFNGDNPSNTTIEELDIISAEYRATWKESYVYDSIIQISNYSRFISFLDNHPMQSGDNELADIFNEEFFENNTIYAYIKSESSGSNQLNADRAEIEYDSQLETKKLILHMNRTVAEIGTTDMATRICLFGIGNDDIQDFTNIVAVVHENRIN